MSTTRRAFVAGIPTLAIGGSATASAPDLSPHIERVMDSAVPSCAGWQQVNADALRALCEAAGVEWASHWAMRGKQ